MSTAKSALKIVQNEPTPIAENRKIKIAFIDDEQSILNSLQRLLRKSPYEVWVTTDPSQLLEWGSRVATSNMRV